MRCQGVPWYINSTNRIRDDYVPSSVAVTMRAHDAVLSHDPEESQGL